MADNDHDQQEEHSQSTPCGDFKSKMCGTNVFPCRFIAGFFTLGMVALIFFILGRVLKFTVG